MASMGMPYIFLTELTVASGSGAFPPTGYVAINDTLKEIIVVYRGTDVTDAQNLLTVAAFIVQQPTGWICPDCWASAGIVQSVGIVQAGINTAVLNALANPLYSSYSVSFVGHSLGGACATLSAAQFRVDNPTVVVKNTVSLVRSYIRIEVY
jgi:hypothetical protein